MSRWNPGTDGQVFGPKAAQLVEFDANGKYIREIGHNLYGFGFAHTVRVDKHDNIWTTDKALPELRQRIEERWEASEIVVILPAEDEEMSLAHLDDEHDRVLFVWWD